MPAGEVTYEEEIYSWEVPENLDTEQAVMEPTAESTPPVAFQIPFKAVV